MPYNDVVNVGRMRGNVSALSDIQALGRHAHATTAAARIMAPRSLAGMVATPGCIAFLWAYAAIHLAHERGLDPAAAAAISPIPLFSTFVLALAAAVTASVAAALVHRVTGRRVGATPRLLAYSIGFFGAVMVLFP